MNASENSRRNRRRAHIEAKHREIRKVMGEVITGGWRSRYAGTWEKLEKPIFWGYRRYFELREDLARRNDASHLRHLVRLVQNLEYSRRKDFRKRNWPSRRWLEHVHEPKALTPQEYRDKVPVKLRKYFTTWHDGHREYYILQYQWMLVSKRKKEYNTHRLIPDRELLSRQAYLENRIEQGCYRLIWWNMTYGRHSWRWRMPRYKDKLRDRYHQDDIAEALHAHWEGDMISLLNLKKELDNA